MDLRLELPQTPVRLAPGVETPVPLRLTSPVAASVRVVVAGGRAADWTRPEPPTVDLPPGAAASVDLHFRPPADLPASGRLVPFTVRVEDASSGAPAGWASGLLSVAPPDLVTAELEPVPERSGDFGLRLRSQANEPMTVLINARLDRISGTAGADPSTAYLPAGGVVTATVRAHPRPALVGAPRTYAVIVAVSDVAQGNEDPALLTVSAVGRRGPRLSSRVVGVWGTILLVLATGGILLAAGKKLPLPGKDPPAKPTAVATADAPIRRPFVLVDTFPHQGAADGGRAAADAARQRLVVAGMAVRMVDSLASDQLADPAGGFWVLLRDGFSSDAEAQAYCERFRSVAPKCKLAQ
jgi:hypothetical protein